MIEQKYKESFYESFLWFMEGNGVTEDDIQFPDEMDVDASMVIFSHFSGKEGLSMKEVLELGFDEFDFPSLALRILKEVHEERTNG